MPSGEAVSFLRELTGLSAQLARSYYYFLWLAYPNSRSQINAKETSMERNTRRLSLTLTALVVLGLAAYYASADPEFSEWSAPVNLGPTINSPFTEAGPAISKNGLSLYFYSNRPGGFGSNDIWVSQRASLDAPWGEPVNLGPNINTSDGEITPSLSRDGHWLFVAGNRPGGFGDSDIWASWRT